VSGHGYRAALIMALVMSAAAIHAQGTDDPAALLGNLYASLREELQTTEMFLTVFYGVLDGRRGVLRYANAGHPHAFAVADGAAQRLAATGPPLGMVEQAPVADVRPWDSARDTLLLFTDGLTDARDRHGRRLGEQPVLDTVLAAARAEPEELVERVFGMVTMHTGDAPRRDDLTLVVARG
jgi:sigma-B regulation protein RsbU (phosphoserine phosphatase)